MKIATCNVNGIRAAARKGMGEWIARVRPDILLLQETRAPEELIAPLIGDGYTVFSSVCRIKGRAGVAVALRTGIEAGEVRAGLDYDTDGDGEPDVDSGRWLEVDIPDYDLTVVSAYLHAGDSASEDKMSAKYAHLDAVTKRLEEKPTHRLLVAGDFNIVRGAGDIKNWSSNHNRTAGALDEEIAYLDKWFDGFGYSDVHRELTPEGEQIAYTWWSQRGRAFDNDTGWRIDYHLASPDLAGLATSVRVDKAPSYDTRFSDHAPLIIDYTL
ncbi:MAG: endonuclease/exonuclease/phosphatase family protein [Actinomycetaceae bacterium]|nr:endonuclease/exonuclease/phosphatase family protein [Actinomycetaceae bacterium]